MLKLNPAIPFTLYDFIDTRLVGLESAGKLRSAGCRRELDYFSHIIWRQSGLATTTLAIFRDAIGGVVGWCSKKKMLRILTRWIVALMEHAFPFRDFSAKEYPGCAMRKLGSSLLASSDKTISPTIKRTDPFPAAILVEYPHLFHEPLVKTFSRRSLSNPFFTTLARACFGSPTFLGKKLFLTDNAIASFHSIIIL